MFTRAQPLARQHVHKGTDAIHCQSYDRRRLDLLLAAAIVVVLLRVIHGRNPRRE